MDNRRLLLAALLSAVILIFWNMLFAPPPRRPAPESAGDETVAARRSLAEADAVRPGAAPEAIPEDGAPAPRGEGLLAEEPAPEPAAAEPVVDFGAETVAGEVEERPVIENEAMRAEFTSRGAQLLSYRLKGYLNAEGEPLELVKARGSDPYPFALVVAGERSHRLNRALFEFGDETDPEGNRVLRFRHRRAGASSSAPGSATCRPAKTIASCSGGWATAAARSWSSWPPRSKRKTWCCRPSASTG